MNQSIDQMEEATRNLPPSKRFKFLDAPPSASLPAKKRRLPAATCILPAKKRVWAPNPLSPLKSQEPATAIKHQEPKDDGEEEEDDGIICAVCGGTDGNPADPIVFCDGEGCGLTVHASCYGNPLALAVPDGDWFCGSCSDQEDGGFRCCLCPQPGGALKRTTDGRWAHILCALLVPEVFFQDPEGKDGIDCSRVPERRWSARCYLCGCESGCAIECSEAGCGLGFHVSCGIDGGLCIEYKEGGGRRGGAIVVGFCGDHTELWKKQQLTGKFKIVARETENELKGKKARC